MDNNSIQPVPEHPQDKSLRNGSQNLVVSANTLSIAVLNFLVRWITAPTFAFVLVGFISYLANHCIDFWYDFFVYGSIAGFTSLAVLILQFLFLGLRTTRPVRLTLSFWTAIFLTGLLFGRYFCTTWVIGSQTPFAEIILRFLILFFAPAVVGGLIGIGGIFYEQKRLVQKNSAPVEISSKEEGRSISIDRPR